jgi:hypothetical protein
MRSQISDGEDQEARRDATRRRHNEQKQELTLKLITDAEEFEI